MTWTSLLSRQVLVCALTFLCMDFVFLLAYGVGNYLTGPLGDRFPLRVTIPCGMWLACLMYLVAMAMGLGNVTVFAPFVIIWVVNGLGQSTVWAGTVAVVGNWLPKKHRGTVMGPWSTNASVGDIMGDLFAGLLLEYNIRWEYVTLIAAVFTIVVGVIFISLVTDKPPASLLASEPSDLKQELQPFDDKAQSSFHSKHGIPVLEALRLPGVLLYSFDYAAVKMLNYGMMFWLPYYFHNHLHVSDFFVGVISAMFDVGAILGSSVIGWISDKVGSRVLVVTPLLVISLPVFYCFRLGTEDTVWIYYILVLAAGFTVSTASNIISGAVAVDLAKNEEIQITSEALATVAAIIDGTGSLGAAVGVLAIGQLAAFSWDAAFYFIMGVNFFAFALLIQYCVRDYRKRTWRGDGKDLGNTQVD